MKVLVISECGEIIDICRRMVEEGNTVDIWVKDNEQRVKKIGAGLGVNLLDVPKNNEDYDLIIFDGAIFGDVPDKIRKNGYKVIGGNKLTDNFENERDYFYKVAHLLGIKTPKVYEFDTSAEVIRFIKKYPKEYVLKSCSDNKSITLVAKEKNSADLMAFVSNLDNVKKFYIQEKVKGYEVAISCFFNGDKFIPPVIVNYEHKKFGTHNTGVFTGEMGTVLVLYPTLNMRFFNETLRKIEPFLKNKYVGIVDINTIVNTSGVWCLEPTMRFGYPITDIMSSFVKSWSELFTDLVNGRDILKHFDLENPIAIGVVLSAISPFEKKNPLIGLPLVSFEQYKQNFSVYGVSNNKIVDNYVGVVHCADKSIKLAQEKVYSLVEKINTPSLFYYRTDIGETTETAHKWLSGQKFFVLLS
jgi:phosphoribosylamine--glycine ligase